ncbi:hypothetical protein [Microbacterium sp. MYb45]|uniref:hypothetical protein n=1 Tax=Microbacterium sp. MYb45 TaxID=1827294 RepID=UPI000CFEFE6F|nr:hypothetical protein [Microbacterium sp. MYb45]PRB61629.1 hypothetical protein CQ034_11770 [Microbacterium sp. MYb45]
MSTEVLAIIISAVGVALTLGTSLFAAGAWMIRRFDDRIDAIAADPTDLKISVARLEGPPRHLITAGRG